MSISAILRDGGQTQQVLYRNMLHELEPTVVVVHSCLIRRNKHAQQFSRTAPC